ncbi:MAG: cupin domain-containing protein [Ferruginibacter sp.]
MEQKITPKEPIIISANQGSVQTNQSTTAIGASFIMHEWRGSGPDYLHVHYEDDEAWHVLEGMLTFKFKDRVVEATKGTTVFVPAGVPHTYFADDSARYLIILTPRLNELISALQIAPYPAHASIMKKFESEILN